MTPGDPTWDPLQVINVINFPGTQVQLVNQGLMCVAFLAGHHHG